MMKYICTWTAFLLLVIVVNTVAAAAPKDYQLRKKARPLMAQKRYDEAVKVYVDAAENIHDAVDNEIQAYCFTQASMIALLNIKDQEAAFKLAAQIRDPHRAAGHRLYLLRMTEQYQQLLEEFSQTDFSNWPMDIQTQSYAARAKALIETGQQDKVEADLDKASQTPGPKPVRLWACYMLGQYYENQKHDLDKAVDTYTIAMNLTKANYAWRVRSLQARSRLMLETGQSAQLIKDYKKLDFDTLRSSSVQAKFYIMLADAHLMEKNFGQAATILTKALRLPEINSDTKKLIQDKIDHLALQMQGDS